MSKYSCFIIVFAALVGLGFGLTCNSCDTKESCENPTSEKCTDDQTLCASVRTTDPFYFKGCAKGDGCKDKDHEGNLLYPDCEVCDKDNCNMMELK